MKKSRLLVSILFLFSGAVSAAPVSGFTLSKTCGADTATCDTYSALGFDFLIFVDRSASGEEDRNFPFTFQFGTEIGLTGYRQDAIFTITETPPSAVWADVMWNPICTVPNGAALTSSSTSPCFSFYDDSVPNQVSFSLTLDATMETLTIQAVNSPVPVPAAVWLFGSGLLGLVGIARRSKKAA